MKKQLVKVAPKKKGKHVFDLDEDWPAKRHSPSKFTMSSQEASQRDEFSSFATGLKMAGHVKKEGAAASSQQKLIALPQSDSKLHVPSSPSSDPNKTQPLPHNLKDQLDILNVMKGAKNTIGPRAQRAEDEDAMDYYHPEEIHEPSQTRGAVSQSHQHESSTLDDLEAFLKELPKQAPVATSSFTFMNVKHDPQSETMAQSLHEVPSELHISRANILKGSLNLANDVDLSESQLRVEDLKREGFHISVRKSNSEEQVRLQILEQLNAAKPAPKTSPIKTKSPKSAEKTAVTPNEKEKGKEKAKENEKEKEKPEPGGQQQSLTQALKRVTKKPEEEKRRIFLTSSTSADATNHLARVIESLGGTLSLSKEFVPGTDSHAYKICLRNRW